MNNLAYSTQQPEKVASQVEEKLRKELAASAPVAYQIEKAEGAGPTAGTVLGDMARGLLGGHASVLFTLVFDVATPRPAQLRAMVERQGVGCHVGPLLYSAPLPKPIKGEVALEAPKMFGSSKFTGEAETSAKLNARADLMKRLGKLARTEGEIGGLTLKMDRLVKLVPQDTGSLLVVGTLPRATSMGMDAALDAKEFLDVAALVEGAL